MGGHALKKVTLVRLPKEIYQKVESCVVDKYLQLELNVFVTRYLDSKLDFGDLDLIVETPPGFDIKASIQKLFEPVEIVANGNVFSFSYLVDKGLEDVDSSDPRYFQIDIISVPPEDFVNSKFYFSYGDMGAIIGAITKHWGFSFGGNGLTYDVCASEGDHTTSLSKIVVTKDPYEVCEITGLDPGILTEWLGARQDSPSGLPGGQSKLTETDLFDWVTGSRLFYPEFWSSRSKKWNYENRSRLKDRPMYQRFIYQYLPKKFGWEVDLRGVSVEDRIDMVPPEVRREFTHDVLTRYNKMDLVNKVLEDKRLSLLAKSRFNGKIVSEVLGIEKKELQAKMIELKTRHPDTLGNVSWLVSDERTEEDILSLVRS